MKSISTILLWLFVGLIGVGALGYLALARGESISAVWLIIAAFCIYAAAFRFYSRFIAEKIFEVDATRATPAERLADGKDYVVTHPAVVFGHHFAAIAGAGPLIGPVLATQLGYLPGALWLIIGVVCAGAVQDLVILLGSIRRDGKSLGEMAEEELGLLGGWIPAVGIFTIMIILLAVLALIVVKALTHSPWGLFTVMMTFPISILMGVYLRFIRPNGVLEASCVGFVLLLLALWAGQWVGRHPDISHYFNWDAPELALAIAIYGFIASVLPVWLLLAPRDYLSAYLKISTILLLAIGVIWVHPTFSMPAVTKFIDGTGPVFSGPLFPFLFITIACGALSGFHSLVASGTTPKLIARESHARAIGFGAMLLESFVGIMALIAASILHPGVYFAMNTPVALLGSDVASAAQTISQWGFIVTPEILQEAARSIEESSILSRAGGAPTLALGMSEIFSQFLSGAKAFWYHFAILFEAVFILTTVDAGTRIGRFILQDLLGQFHPPFAQLHRWRYNVIASLIVSSAWGYILYQGAIDPFGGINSLWALFGIANQMLAVIALGVGTTFILTRKKAKYVWVTIIPMTAALIITFTAGIYKLFSSDPKLGFIANAQRFKDALNAQTILAPANSLHQMSQIIFNNELNVVFTLIFMTVVALLIISSTKRWYDILILKKTCNNLEIPYQESHLLGKFYNKEDISKAIKPKEGKSRCC